MLNSLYKLGLQLEEGDELDRLLLKPTNLDPKKKYLVFGISLDLDNCKILIDSQYLEQYSAKHSIKKYKCFGVISGNARKMYLSVESKQFSKMIDTIYNYATDSKGDLLSKFDSFGNKYVDTEIYLILSKIYELRNNFEVFNKLRGINLQEGETYNLQTFFSGISKTLGLAGNEEIYIYYLNIKSTAFNITEFTPMAELGGYVDFVKELLLPKATSKESLCYVTGKNEKNISEAEFIFAKSLNKIFVKTTINYATNFDSKFYYKNYKISMEAKNKIELASKFAMDNLNIHIAGIPHLIIPELPHNPNLNTNQFLEHLKHNNDLVFNNNEYNIFLKDFKEENEIEKDNIYWVNYIGYETDGKFFKIINRIKDVNNIHFDNVVNTFAETGIQIDKNNSFVFNLHRLYSIVPIRNPETKKNAALSLISSILERREIDIQILFDCFKELIIYYFLERSKITGQYKNVYPKYSKEKFDFAVKTSVTNYLILFKSLLKLQQLKNHNFNEGMMEEKNTNNSNNQLKEYELFNSLNYSDSQKAMFYLGRMVNSIGYAQYEKGHEQKPILQKINFNGMALRDIAKLRNELFEKARQYNKTDLITFLDGRFSALFDYNSWKLPPNEALFFLLNGYSYFINSKEVTIKNESTEEQNG